MIISQTYPSMKTLSEKAYLLEEIRYCRLMLEMRVGRLGLNHPDVLRLSKLLDKLVVKAQRKKWF